MKQSQLTILAVLVGIVAVLATVAYLGMSGEQEPYDGGGGDGDHLDDVGDDLQIAADFTLPVVDEGTMLTLSDLQGKVVVLDFFATWCSPCSTQIGYLKDIQDDYSESEVVIISVDVDNNEGEDLISIYKDQKGIDWTVVRAGSDVSSEPGYEVTGIPTMVIVDQEGKIAFREVGVTTDKVLKAEIDKLLP